MTIDEVHNGAPESSGRMSSYNLYVTFNITKNCTEKMFKVFVCF